MSRYIDVTPFVAELQTYINYIKKKHGDCAVTKTLETVIEQISELPTADVAPVIHAHWIDTGESEIVCSHCGHLTIHLDFEDKTIEMSDGLAFALCNPPYCKHCGAKMDEVAER